MRGLSSLETGRFVCWCVNRTVSLSPLTLCIAEMMMETRIVTESM